MIELKDFISSGVNGLTTISWGFLNYQNRLRLTIKSYMKIYICYKTKI
jgi:hypothetical protein